MQIEITGIDSLIRRLENMKSNLETKQRTFLERLAEIGMNTAQIRFKKANYDGNNDVSVGVEWQDENTLAVKASGTSVLFIEFGAGISFPEHPLADQYGYHHGTYGQGKGANRKGWIYKGERGTGGMDVLIRDKNGHVVGTKPGVYRTFGNEPARAMYAAGKQMRENIKQIATEVFGND